MNCARWLLALLLAVSAWAKDPFYGGAAPRTREAVTQVAYFAYTVGYCEQARSPLWSAYFVEAKVPPEPPHKVDRKGFSFFTEYRTEAQVTTRDYNKSGYSRGHLTPFAAIAYSFGDSATSGGEEVNPARETFSMANIAPQLQRHNAGIWSNLEDAVAGVRTAGGFAPGLTQHAARIWVYTGPVLAGKGPAATISDKEIPVPTAFWKAAIWITPRGEARACAWIIPHDPDLEARTFMDYATTLAEVRRQAHVTILPEDPEGLMERCDRQELER